MQQLQATEAAIVWSYFLDICAIPHPSRHEQQLVDWIVSWAEQRHISCVQDEVGNLILRKPATAGAHSKTPVILQAHLDMVPQKNNNTVHNFAKDPITPIIDGEWMHADNTTLGADNGIGLASCLAVLASESIEHGPLEVLLTTSEEVGMVGAFALQADLLAGKVLINTDSEQEGDLYIGCAGGVRAYADFPHQNVAVGDGDLAFEIALTGLKGGHSGCDIHLQRGNAITLLAQCLSKLDENVFKLSTFTGGSLRNAIPREARAVVTCAGHNKVHLQSIIASLQNKLQRAFQNIETDLQLSLCACALPNTQLAEQDQKRLLVALTDCPNGIFAMDENLAGVVQTSSNLGVLSQGNDLFTMEMLVRSQVEQEKQQAWQKIETHFQQFGATCRQEGDYPGWKPNPDSAVFKIAQTQYAKLFNSTPNTMVIHAGLECGLFSNKYPHWDMISFGPTIKFPHSPDEKVHIPSVERYWKLLVATLQAID